MPKATTKRFGIFFFFFFFIGTFIALANGQHTENSVREGKIGFLNGAASMLSSLAQDLATKSATSSKVLSLNLTNLFILVVLKAIIFGAGAFASDAGHGRSVQGFLKPSLFENFDFDRFLSETEFLMMLSYMRGDLTKDYGCLQRIACQDPGKAQQYSFTGKLFLKGSELFSKSWSGSKYENAIIHLDEAIEDGLRGENCMEKYRCEVN